MRRPAQWIGLQLVADCLLRRARDEDIVDVRDPLIDLTVCPTCGTDITKETASA